MVYFSNTFLIIRKIEVRTDPEICQDEKTLHQFNIFFNSLIEMIDNLIKNVVNKYFTLR
jgi:hypothetical protein